MTVDERSVTSPGLFQISIPDSLISRTDESLGLLENLINTTLRYFPAGLCVSLPLSVCFLLICRFSPRRCHFFSQFIKGFAQMSLLFFLTNKTLVCLSSPAVLPACHRGLVSPSGQMLHYTLMSDCTASLGPLSQPGIVFFILLFSYLLGVGENIITVKYSNILCGNIILFQRHQINILVLKKIHSV